jgi:hypothetical protein
MSRITELIYPAVGFSQVCFGTDNGIHAVWFLHDNIVGKVIHQNSREDALQCYDDMRDVLKTTENLI